MPMIRGPRDTRRTDHEFAVKPRDTIDDKRLLAAQTAVQNKAKIKQLFLKYDVDKSQKLDLNELKMLLAELSNRDPSTITTHEVSFVLRMADQTNPDGEIDREETAGAIAAWNVLQQDQDFWASRFDEFATTEGEDISPEQLKGLLLQLNGEESVTDEEVAWVFRRADLNKNGSIDRDEMRVAVAIWYTHVNFTKKAPQAVGGAAGGSGCCVVM